MENKSLFRGSTGVRFLFKLLKFRVEVQVRAWTGVTLRLGKGAKGTHHTTPPGGPGCGRAPAPAKPSKSKPPRPGRQRFPAQPSPGANSATRMGSDYRKKNGAGCAGETGDTGVKPRAFSSIRDGGLATPPPEVRWNDGIKSPRPVHVRFTSA